MAVAAEFCLLGPLTVRSDGVPVRLSAAKQRAVLAALLLRANTVVSVDDLAEVLWGEDVPASARVSVQNYVMRLRKALGPAALRIATQSHGYLLQVEAGELDLTRFESLLRDARTAARYGRWPEAADQAASALGLWRGEPLADVGSELLLAQEGPRLAELRLQAVEVRLDADLHLGRHGDVIAELRKLAAEHPLRERVHVLLMLALYREGRQADALAAYQHARSVLAEQLGAEPGPDLQQLQRQILATDPALLRPAAAAAPPPAAPVPRELPGDVAAFTGRAAELAELDRILLGPEVAAGKDKVTGVLIAAVSGTAGVGKTALAVHWAHHAAVRFPAGQLYVNLRGYDPDQPVAATDALAAFLRALGVPGGDIPPGETERAARYRSLLAGRQMLILLDNAATAEQVRTLLPGVSECRAIVTSRDSLAGLVARDGARRLDLDLLPRTDAVALLRELIGARVDAEPAAAVVLAEQCARLPLALRVAAELAATRPDPLLIDLVAELEDQQQRLDLLEVGGDARTAVRSVFSWSYHQLDADTARAFRLAGLHPGADFDGYALAALAGTSREQALRLLATLTRAHLIQPAEPSRYSMHDLLRAYARELVSSRDGEQLKRAAVARLLDYYVHCAAAATDGLYPAERQRRPDIPPPATPVPSLADRGAARAWLNAELPCLVAATAQSAQLAWSAHTPRLSVTLYRYLQDGRHVAEALTIHGYAREAARHNGDRVLEAEALMGMAGAELASDRNREAVDYYEQALALFREAGDQTGQARALDNLGRLEFDHGSCQDAAKHHRQAISLFHQTGDRVGEARALSNLGRIDQKQGRYSSAVSHHRRALAIFRDIGDRHFESFALARLARIDIRLGHYEQAMRGMRESLAVFRELGNTSSEAEALTWLGVASMRQGYLEQAADCQQRALALSRDVADPSAEALALNGLGDTLLAAGRPAEARAMHRAALDLADQLVLPDQLAWAQNGLAHAYRVTGDAGRARKHWQAALALYTELGAPEADEVRGQLAAIDGDPGVGT